MTTPISYTLSTAAAATGLSKAYFAAAIRSGRLRARKSGEDAEGNPAGSYIIMAADLTAYLESLADA